MFPTPGDIRRLGQGMSKAITWDYTGAEVYQQSQSEKYTHQPVQSDKNAGEKNPIHFFFFLINHPFRPMRNSFFPLLQPLSWRHIYSQFSPFARQMIIQQWHFPALQRDGLGKCLVCWPTQARSSLRRCTENGHISSVTGRNKYNAVELVVAMPP